MLTTLGSFVDQIESLFIIQIKIPDIIFSPFFVPYSENDLDIQVNGLILNNQKYKLFYLS